MSAQQDAKGFFGALFDLSFTTFVTLRFLKVIYAVMVGLILLTGLIFFVASLMRGGAAVLVGLVVVPIVTLLYLVLARVSLEAVALFFRIGENTTIMAGRNPAAGPVPPSYPASPSSIH
ncbi:MAG: DUF4282 domain-containing protein [Oryzihumus sp.]|jgi:hypothetical protein